MAKSKRIDKPPDTYTGSQTEWEALSGNKQYRIVKKVKIATRDRIRDAKNRDISRENLRLYRSKNPDKVRAGALQWKTENIERVKSVIKACNKNKVERKREWAHRPENKAKMEVIQAKWYTKNKEKVAAKSNRQKINARERALTVKKREALHDRISVAVAASYKEIAE